VDSEDGGWPGYRSDNPKPQEIAVLEGVAIEAPPPPKYIRLGSIRQIRYELAAVYRLARTGKLATSEATRLTYILNTLASLTLDADIENRVENLERGDTQ
jgi:hypothetical protein